MSSEERFGYEWHKYNKILPEHEGQFLMWISPLQVGDFKNQIVLDAGCGMGRNSYWVCVYGAKKLIAFDYNQRSVQAARLNLKDFPQAEVKYESIYQIDYKNQFDIVFSIGVIHHLKKPEEAIRKLYDALKPGGRLVLWVYGDGLKYKIKLINLVRSVTSKLPLPLTHFLTYFFSVPLFIYLQIIPQYSEYLKLLKTFSFKHVHAIAFDQLIPQVANYWNEKKLAELVSSAIEGSVFKITSIRNYSWSVIIFKHE